MDRDGRAEGAGGVEGAAGPEDAWWVRGWILVLGLLSRDWEIGGAWENKGWKDPKLCGAGETYRRVRR